MEKPSYRLFVLLSGIPLKVGEQRPLSFLIDEQKSRNIYSNFHDTSLLFSECL